MKSSVRFGSMVAALLLVMTLAAPTRAHAFPFGGSIGQIIFCFNNAIWSNVGAPRGGQFIWTPSTKTYQFGAPQHTGQWLLGLAAPPYFCVVSIEPVIVFPGILITMMGSSGPAAPAYRPPPSTPPPGSPWKYSQFTTAAQYDAEASRLRDSYVSCINSGRSGCETISNQADEIRDERIQRFGAPTITCDPNTNCIVN